MFIGLPGHKSKIQQRSLRNDISICRLSASVQHQDSAGSVGSSRPRAMVPRERWEEVSRPMYPRGEEAFPGK